MKTNPLDPHFDVPVFGTTRTRVAQRHALISSDGFVPSHWPGASGADVVFHITPAMGADFTQARIALHSRGTVPLPAVEKVERFLFVVSGTVQAEGVFCGELSAGEYAYLPPHSETKLSSGTGAVLTLFEKRFEPVCGHQEPGAFVGKTAEREAVPFLGHAGARLQTLLPDNPSFDMAVNLFTYDPGAFLPFVETHIMEHGLLMLAGHGIYRLGDDWYPVREGDVIWMAPYCPQWFVAMGDKPAQYLYYKNVNRLPLG